MTVGWRDASLFRTGT